MSPTIRFHPDAEEELAHARQWYDERREGLGTDFLLCMEEAIERIRRAPDTYPVVYRDVRQVIVRRFPYIILYRIEGEQIVVFAVFHASRNPDVWKQRL